MQYPISSGIKPIKSRLLLFTLLTWFDAVEWFNIQRFFTDQSKVIETGDPGM